MTHRSVHTDAAPKAIGPYSQAIIANGFVFTAGQTGLVPETMVLAGDDVVAQAHQVMKNLQAVLTAAGTSFDNVIKTNIFLNDMNDFAAVNEVYSSYFKSGNPLPARSTVGGLSLPKAGKVEIEMVAVLP